MAEISRRFFIFVFLLFVVSLAFFQSQHDLGLTVHFLRRSLSTEPSAKLAYKLPQSAARWCLPNPLPRLTYRECDPNGRVNKIKFIAGLTNGLKMMLLDVIKSYEDNQCFYISEEHNHLILREDKRQQIPSFINRYFEPIGLNETDPIVVRAKAQGRMGELTWKDGWNSLETRRTEGTVNSIPSLHYFGIGGRFLKQIMLQRLWRPLPHIRHHACSTLESHGLSEEFMVWSIRRGDKTIEGFEYTDLSKYFVAADRAIPKHFDGKVPVIFVATDDCSVLPEIRSTRPTWTFVSQCDRGHSKTKGFVLSDMKKWDIATTDAHYMKFFVELFALATAKYYIGVSYTNVAWWAYFMRPNRWSFELIDQKQPTAAVLNVW